MLRGKAGVKKLAKYAGCTPASSHQTLFLPSHGSSGSMEEQQNHSLAHILQLHETKSGGQEEFIYVF